MNRRERGELYAKLVVATHRVMCSPLENNGNGRFRALDPGIIRGEHCICRGYPLPYVGPNGLDDLRDPVAVPQTTRIRTSRCKNIALHRLISRLEFLRDYITRSREWAEQKEDFRARVREILAIENELTRRRVECRRVTRRDW